MTKQKNGAIMAKHKTCGHSSVVEYQLPKLTMRVRFPLPAPNTIKPPAGRFYCFLRRVYRIGPREICVSKFSQSSLLKKTKNTEKHRQTAGFKIPVAAGRFCCFLSRVYRIEPREICVSKFSLSSLLKKTKNTENHRQTAGFKIPVAAGRFYCFLRRVYRTEPREICASKSSQSSSPHINNQYRRAYANCRQDVLIFHPNRSFLLIILGYCATIGVNSPFLT